MSIEERQTVSEMTKLIEGFAINKTLKQTFTNKNKDYPSHNGELRILHGWKAMALYWALILGLACIVLSTNLRNIYAAIPIISLYIFGIIRCATLGVDLLFFFAVFLNFLTI